MPEAGFTEVKVSVWLKRFCLNPSKSFITSLELFLKILCIMSYGLIKWINMSKISDSTNVLSLLLWALLS